MKFSGASSSVNTCGPGMTTVTNRIDTANPIRLATNTGPISSSRTRSRRLRASSPRPNNHEPNGCSARCSSALFTWLPQHDQQIPAFDLLHGVDRQSVDGARLGCGDGRFHLHRLDGGHRVALLDLVPFGD